MTKKFHEWQAVRSAWRKVSATLDKLEAQLAPRPEPAPAGPFPEFDVLFGKNKAKP